MNYFILALYIFSILVMIATPGPVMLLVASTGLKQGYLAALKTILGTNLASLILIGLSILMLKGLFTVNAILFEGIKLLGCLYIAYLGIEILKSYRLEPVQNLTTSNVQGGFQRGFLTGISNPKDIIFFSSFFPQFIGLHPDLNISLSILVVVWIALDFLTLSLVYLGFKRLSDSIWSNKILAICGMVLLLIAAYGLYNSLTWLISYQAGNGYAL